MSRLWASWSPWWLWLVLALPWSLRAADRPSFSPGSPKRRALRRANRLGDPPLRVRIGVLAGTAIVGEIGTDQRVSYTAVGRVVNEASRLRELGKEIDAAADVAALTTTETATTETATAGAIAATLGPETPIRPRGGHEDLHVVRLV